MKTLKKFIIILLLLIIISCRYTLESCNVYIKHTNGTIKIWRNVSVIISESDPSIDIWEDRIHIRNKRNKKWYTISFKNIKEIRIERIK